ncbi:RxLR effector protein [Phytophthora megakarya]|uniref:RxLR effector protein n=1 Tax=Phytophthora megakarya TaxID=4795 RepID=A0A225W5A8_9STRA|nr:RxLR effector protein [Phytophthora megakarya]
MRLNFILIVIATALIASSESRSLRSRRVLSAETAQEDPTNEERFIVSHSNPVPIKVEKIPANWKEKVIAALVKVKAKTYDRAKAHQWKTRSEYRSGRWHGVSDE